MDYIDIIIITLVICSVLFFTLAVIGVIRFPEFYTRVHAASIGDTLSTMMLLLAVILFVLKTDGSFNSYLVSLKIFFIIVFMFLTGPTGVHTLLNAGYEIGRKPFIKKDSEMKLDDNEAKSNDSNECETNIKE